LELEVDSANVDVNERIGSPSIKLYLLLEKIFAAIIKPVVFSIILSHRKKL
jgi:hypothetical protein